MAMAHNVPQTVTQILCLLYTIAALVTSSPSVPQSSPSAHVRSKRHILQMCELIAYHTNRGCLDYNNYGCFCGLGNAASRPMDEVDRCCQAHDRCYGHVTCYWLYPQMVGYDFTCDDDVCSCTNSPTLSSCALTTCQCDLEFAQCLGRARYNQEHSAFDRRECNRPRRRPASDRRRSRRRRRREVLNMLAGV